MKKILTHGIDIFFMDGEIFDMGRTCTPDKKLLNICSGGGMIPMGLK